MDDKVFNLLEKMYVEFTEKFNKVNMRFDKFEQDVSKINIKLENSIEPKINMCLEEVAGVKEKLLEHDKRFDNIDSKIEQHDVEINVIKRVK